MAQKTGPEKIDTAERRAYVMELRRMGLTYRRIAELTKRKFGEDRLPNDWDERYACKDVRREIEKLQASAQNDARIIKTIWMERYERLLAGIWHMAVGSQQVDENGNIVGPPPNMDALDRVLKIGDREAKLTGANAPTEFAVRDYDDLSDLQLEMVANGEPWPAILAAGAEHGDADTPDK